MKKFLFPLLFFAALFASPVCPGQEFIVKSFDLRSNDLKAKSNPVCDLNGDPCALIRVMVALRGCTFEGSIIGEPKADPGEYLVYIPAGTRTLRVKHPDYLPLDFRFPVKIEKNRTYELRLLLPGVPEGELPRVESQFLAMNVTPREAVVFVDSMMRPLTDGMLFLELKLGEHTYQVSAPGYRAERGVFYILEEDKTTLDVALSSAEATLDIAATPSDGVQVLVDGNSRGTAPCRLRVSSGEHRVQLARPGYLTWSELVNVGEGEELRIEAQLRINSSEVTLLAADPKAEIRISGRTVGTGSWTGPLDAGTYSVECRLEGHEPMTESITVSPDGEREFRLSEQVPIFGVLKVVSQPMGADVYLDGTCIGQTPYMGSRILTGRHRVTVVRAGRTTESREVTLERGTPCELSFTMAEGISVVPGSGSGTETAESAAEPASPAAAEEDAAADETYAPGDIYCRNGLRGIVFWVDDTGRHGKILSFEEKSLAWVTGKNRTLLQTSDAKDGQANQQRVSDRSRYPAFGFCADLGGGWYLPSREELAQVFKSKSKINARLDQMGLSRLSSWYWTSTEQDADRAWRVYMYDGRGYNFSKDSANPVRAVAKF